MLSWLVSPAGDLYPGLSLEDLGLSLEDPRRVYSMDRAPCLSCPYSRHELGLSLEDPGALPSAPVYVQLVPLAPSLEGSCEGNVSL